MKNKLNALIRISLCFLFLVPYFLEPFAVEAASSATTIAGLKKELEALKQQKADAENDKKQTQSEINNKNNAIYSAYKEQNAIANDVETAQNKITESESEINASKKDIDSLLKYYQLSSSNNEYFDYITGATTTTDLVLRVSAVEQISNYYKDRIKSLEGLIIENQNLQVELAEKKEELNKKIDATAEALSSLKSQITEINELNEDIDSQINNQQSLIKYYETVCTSDTQLLSSCVSVAASAGWLKPLVKGRITSNFGYRSNPLGSGTTFHNGIDIGGNSEGTPIYAAAAGTVAAVTKKSKCGGNIVYIHVNVNGVAYTNQYAHMLTINVKVGDKVTVDTKVGSVGGGAQTRAWDSCSTGAHLHYAVAKGYYLGGGSYGYSSWSKFIASSINPPGYPSKGVYWYKRV